ncbi:MAG: tetratricopeptide repeat protein [Acidobacteriota bacterium]
MKGLLVSLVCAVLAAAGPTVAHPTGRALTQERSSKAPTPIKKVLELARAARARFDFAGSLRLLDEASREDRDSAVVRVERGLIFLDAEDVSRAGELLEAALREEPSNTEVMIGLAGVELLEGNYKSAEKLLRLVLAGTPQSGSAHSLLSRLFLENDNPNEAAAEAQRAIALEPSNVEALTTLAFVRARQMRPAEVRALARRVVSLDEFNAVARRLLSQYLDGKAGYDQQVSQAARKRYELGRALKQQGQFSEALTEFEAALAAEPRYYRALLSIGDIWLKRGDYERAAGTARLAESVDPDGALVQLQLSYAYRGMKERARIEIGAPNFAANLDRRPAPTAFALTSEIFPEYALLSRRGQTVIDSVVAPLAQYLPRLARAGARHYLLAYDQRPGEVRDLRGSAEEKTLDGRYYDSIRGVGGRVSVSGFEYLEIAAAGGANTLAHEFAHQVHLTAMSKAEMKTIHNLYERARREGRALDYYAAANEMEYFAQGYEAFVSHYKRPSSGITARHTNRELFKRDPELYEFLVKTCGMHQVSSLRKGVFLAGSSCLTRNLVRATIQPWSVPVRDGQQLRLLHWHPRVAPTQYN